MKDVNLNGCKYRTEESICGVLINPYLPPYYSLNTRYENRPRKKWWHIPVAVYVNGIWTLDCLDGVSFNKPTRIGTFKTLDDLLKAYLYLQVQALRREQKLKGI